MLYPFELRAPGSGNRNYDKGFRAASRMGYDLLKHSVSIAQRSVRLRVGQALPASVPDITANTL